MQNKPGRGHVNRDAMTANICAELDPQLHTF